MSAPVGTKRPNSELACVTWLLSLPGVSAGKVATVLPPTALWVDTGFVEVVGVVGGTQLPDAPLRRPVVQVDCWAANPNSDTNPPWGVAFQLAEAVVEATQVDSPHRSKVVELPHGFAPVEVRDVSMLTEPRRFRVPDPAGFARVTMDLQFEWTTL